MEPAQTKKKLFKASSDYRTQISILRIKEKSRSGLTAVFHYLHSHRLDLNQLHTIYLHTINLDLYMGYIYMNLLSVWEGTTGFTVWFKLEPSRCRFLRTRWVCWCLKIETLYNMYVCIHRSHIVYIPSTIQQNHSSNRFVR